MMFCCSLCDNPYSIESSLKRHMIKKHPEAVVPVKKKLECLECEKSFNSRSGLKKHQEIKHNKCFGKSYDKNMKCSECSYKCNYIKYLCSHVCNAHNIEIEKESLAFDSMEEFLAWKEKIELDTKSAFITRNSDKIATGKAGIFYCNRSGYHKSKGNTKRHLKKQGSCKINAFCCAHIKLKRATDGKLLSDFVKTHTGHDLELCHLRLKQSEKDMLAEKIAKKIPFRKIVKEIRQSPSSSTCRVNLVNSKDLYNIRRSYGLDTEGFQQKDNKTSFKPRIHELKQSGYKIPTSSIMKKIPTQNHQDESKDEVLQDSDPPPTTAARDQSQFNAGLEKLKKELDSIADFVTNEAEIEISLRIIKTIKPTLEAMRGNTSLTNFQIKSNFKKGNIAKQRLCTLQTKQVQCSKLTPKNSFTQKKERSFVNHALSFKS